VKKLFIGTIDAAGNVDPRPVIAEFDDAGRLLSRHHLDGQEPHSTIFSPTLLRI